MDKRIKELVGIANYFKKLYLEKKRVIPIERVIAMNHHDLVQEHMRLQGEYNQLIDTIGEYLNIIKWSTTNP